MSDSKGRVVITGLTAGMTITAKEVSTVAGYVLDSTPQTIEISEGDEVQTLYFYNEPEGGVEFTKVSAADKTERIPDTTFEIRKVSDDALVDTVTTGKDGKVYLPLEAGDYYAVETDCPSSFRLDAAPIYFTVEDGQVTRETVTNQPSAVFSSTRWTRTARESPAPFSCFMTLTRSLSVNTPRMTGDTSISTI